MTTTIRNEAFTIGGRRIPPLAVRGTPGSVWPSSSGLRLDLAVRSTGGRLRVGGLADVATVEARRVVEGVPGAWVDVGTTDLFVVTEAAGETLTLDLRVTFSARAPGLYIRRFVFLEVRDRTASGY